MVWVINSHLITWKQRRVNRLHMVQLAKMKLRLCLMAKLQGVRASLKTVNFFKKVPSQPTPSTCSKTANMRTMKTSIGFKEPATWTRYLKTTRSIMKVKNNLKAPNSSPSRIWKWSTVKEGCQWTMESTFCLQKTTWERRESLESHLTEPRLPRSRKSAKIARNKFKG